MNYCKFCSGHHYNLQSVTQHEKKCKTATPRDREFYKINRHWPDKRVQSKEYSAAARAKYKGMPEVLADPVCDGCNGAYVLRRCYMLRGKPAVQWLWQRDCKCKNTSQSVKEEHETMVTAEAASL